MALIALFIAHDAWSRAQERYLRVAAPSAALKRSPTDMVALQKVVDDDLAAGKLRRVTASDVRKARAGLVTAPINAAAFRIIGMSAELAGNDIEASKAFSLSETMSRRNMFVQLWLIEYAVGKGDVAEALKHYDVALSVRPALADVLFPVLSSAMANPPIRVALQPYVLRKASWTGSLLSYAAMHGNPHDVLALLAPLRTRLSGATFNDVSRMLTNRLIDSADVPTAMHVVGWQRPGVASSLISLPVRQETLDPQLGAFAWRLLNEQGLTTNANDQHGFDVTARPLASGVAAVRVLPVSPEARYVFQQRLQTGASIQGAYRWQVACAGSSINKPFFDQLVYPGNGTQRWVISIPAGCMGVRLMLHVDGPDGQLQSSASVTDLAWQLL